MEVLRHGMDDDTAFEVEAAAIDLIRLGRGGNALHNLVAGHGLDDRGCAPPSELRARYGAEPIEIDSDDRISCSSTSCRAYRPGMTQVRLLPQRYEQVPLRPHEARRSRSDAGSGLAGDR